ncbi:hypothetical protein Ccrd_016334 [Cynara cardunculus var. scolymus]|uniref:Protein kinase domain-containing protein n=1 Tax=Cynara cardunculus var. scolymus TaxID=59895 RepID=A0A103YA68_CYNCS|nr:hypothetical protein Ccrd_016334 [Cynara cardunculus var. scolymus]
MATLAAAGGVGLGSVSVKLHSLNSLPPCPFLGKKFKFRQESTSHGSKFTILRPNSRSTIVAGVELVDFVHNVFVGVGVGLPCTVMECGDMIYRSTLPRSNALTLTIPGAVLALGTLSYLWATPGVAPGFWDMFVLAFVERLFRPTYKKDDFVLGKKLGEGAFGVVYRVSSTKKPNSKVESMILGEVQDLPKGLERENRIIQTVLRQLLFALDGLHSTGIVHRDIKPQNVIFSEGEQDISFYILTFHIRYLTHNSMHLLVSKSGSRTFKIIDLGAAADLRVGINYIPKEFLLDPRYAAPEQYIMSTQTPSAPSAPVAAALSPVLWQLNLPDRFDIYSTGLILLQMAFPSFRSDSGLIQFNRQLKRCDYDLIAWRKSVEPRANSDLRRGFELLDLDGGIGWELLTSMVRYKARQRVSAKAALAHPYFDKEGLLALSIMQNLRLQFFRATQQDYSEAARWVVELMARSGTKKDGGFTEAELQQLREIRPSKKGNPQRNALASVLRFQKKILKTLNESMNELSQQGKSMWWSRWIPREE